MNTVLAQFDKIKVPVLTIGDVHRIEQIKDIVNQAENTGGTIVHTMVDDKLRNSLINLSEQAGVVSIDLMGPLFSRLTDLLEQTPLGHPGLYRKLHQDYFKRIDAIEFTMSHDDGMNPQDCHLADIVILGVSRTGKTPLSIYLSVLGWKVANIPLIIGLPVPLKLFELNRQRIIGLTIEPDQLYIHRKQRELQIGISDSSQYSDINKIREELEFAQKVYEKGCFTVIDVTHKPIETCALEVIELIGQRFKVK